MTRKGRRSAAGTPLPERMARLTNVNPGGCWLWTGAVAGKGYGVINIAGRLTKAHRVSYELHVGPIPDGLVIDHLCRTPLCVRPDHLEPVTNKENTARGEGPSGKAATDARTHCPKGHPYDETHVDRGARFVVAARTTTRTAGTPSVARLPRRRQMAEPRPARQLHPRGLHGRSDLDRHADALATLAGLFRRAFIREVRR